MADQSSKLDPHSIEFMANHYIPEGKAVVMVGNKVVGVLKNFGVRAKKIMERKDAFWRDER